MCDTRRLLSAKQIALNFNGPVSIAIYIDSIESEVQKKTVCSIIKQYFYNIYNSYDIVVSILYPDYSSKYYKHLNLSHAPFHAIFPINPLRNLAVSHINTEYVLMLDVDFTYMSHTINLINDNHFELSKGPSLMIIPSFSWKIFQQENSYKRTKSYLFNKTQLLQLIGSKSIRSFYDKDWTPAQKCTNYAKWYNATDNYQIKYCNRMYEPYFIFKTWYAKNKYKWDSDYIGRGCDDVSHVTWLAYNCFTFQVMHDMFIIHQYSNFSSRPHDQFQQTMERKYQTYFLNNYCDYNALANHCYKDSFIKICKSTNHKHEIIKKQPKPTMVSLNNLTWQVNNILNVLIVTQIDCKHSNKSNIIKITNNLQYDVNKINVYWYFNVYDDYCSANNVDWFGKNKIKITSYPIKNKMAFWIQYVDPNLLPLPSLDYIWFVDHDLALNYFNFNSFIMISYQLHSSISQPIIMPRCFNCRASDFTILSLNNQTFKPGLIAVTTSFIETMAPLFTFSVFKKIHPFMKQIFNHNKDLNLTSWYDSIWCGHCGAAKNLTGNDCTVIHYTPIIHLNTKTINKTKSFIAQGYEMLRRLKKIYPSFYYHPDPSMGKNIGEKEFYLQIQYETKLTNNEKNNKKQPKPTMVSLNNLTWQVNNILNVLIVTQIDCKHSNKSNIIKITKNLQYDANKINVYWYFNVYDDYCSANNVDWFGKNKIKITSYPIKNKMAFWIQYVDPNLLPLPSLDYIWFVDHDLALNYFNFNSFIMISYQLHSS
eukprot:472232_1